MTGADALVHHLNRVKWLVLLRSSVIFTMTVAGALVRRDHRVKWLELLHLLIINWSLLSLLGGSRSCS